MSEIIVASCKQTESLQPTNLVFSVVGLLCSRFSRGRKQTDDRHKILETRLTTHMLKDLPERNTLLAGSQQQTNNYSQEIAHEKNTFERRIQLFRQRSTKAYATIPKGMMGCGFLLLHRQVHEFSALCFEYLFACVKRNNMDSELY